MGSLIPISQRRDSGSERLSNLKVTTQLLSKPNEVHRTLQPELQHPLAIPVAASRLHRTLIPLPALSECYVLPLTPSPGACLIPRA